MLGAWSPCIPSGERKTPLLLPPSLGPPWLTLPSEGAIRRGTGTSPHEAEAVDK